MERSGTSISTWGRLNMGIKASGKGRPSHTKSSMVLLVAGREIIIQDQGQQSVSLSDENHRSIKTLHRSLSKLLPLIFKSKKPAMSQNKNNSLLLIHLMLLTNQRRLRNQPRHLSPSTVFSNQRSITKDFIRKTMALCLSSVYFGRCSWNVVRSRDVIS